MIIWLRQNMGTILITLLLAAAVFLIVKNLLTRKTRNTGCSGNCASCGCCRK